MREIDEAIARDKLGVFHVDVDEPESEHEEDQEGPHATKKEETKIDSKNKDTEDNLETVEDVRLGQHIHCGIHSFRTDKKGHKTQNMMKLSMK